MPRKSDNKKQGETKKTKDNRSGRRIPINLLVDYQSDGNYLFDFCRDLGSGGVFIETKTPLPQGSEVNLTFTLPDCNETLDAKGKVIWVQTPITGRTDLTPGMGVQFHSFSTEQRSTLEHFINRYQKGRGTTPSTNDINKRSA